MLPMLSVAVVMVAGSFAAAPEPSADAAAFAERSVVEVAGLAAFMKQAGDDLVILDVRPEEEYALGHLPGAVRADYDGWSEAASAEETGLAHAAFWHERIGALGIDGDDTVLVYDGGKMTSAARFWFILQHFGVAQAAVVNGGFPLIAEGALRGQTPALTTEPAEAEPAEFTPSEAGAGRVGLYEREALRSAIERGEVQVFDARSAKEYTGEDMMKNARGGHLPTAVNLPHTDLLTEDGRLRPPAELAALMERAGIAKGRPVVTHCQSGGRAALAALAAARAGYGPVFNYYLSFGDWAKDAACAVVQE